MEERQIFEAADIDGNTMTMHQISTGNLIVSVTDEDEIPAGMYLSPETARSLRNTLNAYLGGES
jgi:hypothetical protein